MTSKQSVESLTVKTDMPLAEGAKAFSSLLQEMAGGVKQSDNPEAALPKQLIKKIEDMLRALEEQPIEELTEAQQKIMHELVQLMNTLPARKEGVVLVDTGGRAKFTPILPDVEKQAMPKEVQAKLIELVKKLVAILPVTSAPDSEKMESLQSLSKIEGKTIALDAAKIEKITAKVLEITESLVDSGKKVSTTSVQPEQVAKLVPIAPVQPEQATKLVPIVPVEIEKQMKVLVETKNVNADEPETIKAQSTATVVATGRSDGGQQQETSQQDDNKQSLPQTTTSADTAKSVAPPAQMTQPTQLIQPVQARPEPPVMPTPVIRMNNLTEELGEIFKSSLRMSTSGESTQMKVNISPDHLGHLDIRLTETNGRIAAQIFTSSIAAKEALDLQLNQLRNTLVQHGLTVEKIEVVQQNSQQSLSQQNAQSEQRFTQQQRQSSTGRESNGYQQSEEKSLVERGHLDSGTMKVDYTV